MKIGIIADTHDRLPTLRKALQILNDQRVDAVLHAGDFVAPFAAKLLVGPDAPDAPLHCIYGNNDGERAGLKNVLPQVQDGPLHLRLDNLNIVMHHWIEWFRPEDTRAADVVISGHTHEVVVDQREDQLILNPGECCAWLTGRATIAILHTDPLKAEIIEVHRD